MKFHTANLTPSRYNEADQWVSVDRFTSGNGEWIEYTAYSRYVRRNVRFSVLYQGPDGVCRREHGAPEVPGPYAALIPQATVIAAYPQAKPAQVVELEEGDMIMFNGQPMMMIDDRALDYPQLVTPEEFAVRYPAAQARREAVKVKKAAAK
jgi:hypothetical protein